MIIYIQFFHALYQPTYAALCLEAPSFNSKSLHKTGNRWPSDQVGRLVVIVRSGGQTNDILNLGRWESPNASGNRRHLKQKVNLKVQRSENQELQLRFGTIRVCLVRNK